MLDITTVKLGTILEFKKPHPCGGYTWKVLRTGVDFKLECTTCKHIIMIERINVEKRIKKIIND